KPALVETRFNAELTAAAARRLGDRAKTAGAAEAALADPKTRRAILEDVYRQQLGAKPQIPKAQKTAGGAKPDPDKAAVVWLEETLRSHLAVSEQDLLQLGKARAEAVQAALLGDG